MIQRRSLRFTALFAALLIAGGGLAGSLAAAKPKAAAHAAAPVWPLAGDPTVPIEPRAAFAPHVMVAAANPLAVQAGLKVLKAGGSAADAAVAIQAVLGLVEPQSSGLGGGAYMTYYDAKTRTVTAYDGRETAPAGAGPDLFVGPDGKPLAFFTALLSGRSTGVPGAIAMLSLVQHEHGKLAWSTLFADGQRLGDGGFIVSPRLAGFVHGPFPESKAPDAVRYFSKPDGRLVVAGDRLKNPAYAASLRTIAAEGPKGLLEGRIARDIVARLHEGDLPSSMTLADLAGYRPRAEKALCNPWKTYVVCTPQPESSGVSLLQALAMLEHTDIDRRGPTDPVSWVQIAEAERLMYADRDRYVGDPMFVGVPVAGLLDPAYVASRAAAIGQSAAPTPPSFGLPPMAAAMGPDATSEAHGTSHMVIVDADGNVLSMTTTVESIFGSGRMVDGFFLNNQLTDFSFSPLNPDGLPAANAVAAGKRPRSSMAPVIVLDRSGGFVAALGSPGGSSILSYDLKTMIGVFDWKLPMQQAIALPNMVARGASFSSEPELYAPGVVAALKTRGIPSLGGFGENSGVQGIIKRKGGYEGGADPRREGIARGF
ncbi:MAG: gamma-glutamyltransferase [Caulobacter sp.]|nr:gamma-glutamyltransferase [Caulobacter sp.]